MPPGPFAIIFRYFWVVIIVVLAVNLLWGRSRAAHLVAAGKVTQDELDDFVRGVAILFGGWFLLLGVFQMLGSVTDPVCVLTFPPHSLAGRTMWVAQAFISSWIIWWLWAHDGARLLAVLAPAFLRGPLSDRQLSPTLVGIAVTVLAVIGPVGNILMQLATPTLSGCSAV